MNRGGRRRKRRHGLFRFLLIVLLLAVLLYMKVFIVRDVQIIWNGENTTGYTDDAITRASGLEFGHSIFRIEETEIRRNVNSLGTVAFEKMEYRYPRKISLVVSSRAPAAMILTQNMLAILDRNGIVMGMVSSVPKSHLVYVEGIRPMSYREGSSFTSEPEILTAYTAVMTELENFAAAEYVATLNLTDPENLFLLTRMNTEVKLGDAKNMDVKISWMKSVVLDLEERREGNGVLDVSSGTKGDYRP